MRAMVVRAPGEPSVMTLEEVQEPEVRPHDVLIKVHVCGVCFHDIACRNGSFKYGVRLPIIPGHEIAGVVVALGGVAKGFQVGDRVATMCLRASCGVCRPCRSGFENICHERELMGDRGLNGGYSEYVAIDHRFLSKVPDAVPLESAALAGCAMGCQLNAVRDVGRVVPGDFVLVTGAGGGLGIHGVQLARLAGGRVIAVTSTEEKAERIGAAGAHDVVVVRRGEDFSARIRGLTDGHGVDVAIDNVGTPIFAATRRSLAMGGRWVLVGEVSSGFVPFNPAQLFIRGISMLSAAGARRTQLDDCLELMRNGGLRAVIQGAYPLSDAAKAHAILEAGSPAGRILLQIH